MQGGIVKEGIAYMVGDSGSATGRDLKKRTGREKKESSSREKVRKTNVRGAKRSIKGTDGIGKTFSGHKSESEKKSDRIKFSECVAYLDTEFNAFDYYGQNDGIQEIIEIGLVVMRQGEIIDGFRSFCGLKRGHLLTRRSEQLTGISSEDIENAPDFADVVEHMNVFLDMYSPGGIYAYGPEDRMQLLKTSELYNLRSPELYYINRIQDIMRELSDRLGAKEKTKLSLSVKDICRVCGIEANGIHDAYNDAMYLGRCTEMIMRGAVNPARLDAVLEDKNWLSGYRSSRRFKDKRETIMLRDEQLEPIRYAISRLSKEHRYPDHQLRALWDDLMVITGRNPEFE